MGAGKTNEIGTLYILGSESTLKKKKNTKTISINIDTISSICRKYVPKNEI